jgi:uncharacterized protein YjbI with pentapeptide repeats
MTMFGSAKLSGLKARGVDLFKAFSRGADLAGADFSGARLVLCLFLNAMAPGLQISEALLDKSSFAGSDLTDANVTLARGPATIWSGAKLLGTDFRYAELMDAHFIEVTAIGAKFSAARLERASFYRASLESVEFVKANLLRTNLSKAMMTSVPFIGANLYEAIFRDSKATKCDFTDANTKRAVFNAA